jgi:hypothetical protein
MDGSSGQSPTASGGTASADQLPPNRKWCLCEPCVSSNYHHSSKNYKEHHKSQHERDPLPGEQVLTPKCTIHNCKYLQSLQKLEGMHSGAVVPVIDPKKLSQEMQSAMLTTGICQTRNQDMEKQVCMMQTALDLSKQELLRCTRADDGADTDHVAVMLDFLIRHHPTQLIAAAKPLIEEAPRSAAAAVPLVPQNAQPADSGSSSESESPGPKTSKTKPSAASKAVTAAPKGKVAAKSTAAKPASKPAAATKKAAKSQKKKDSDSESSFSSDESESSDSDSSPMVESVASKKPRAAAAKASAYKKAKSDSDSDFEK